MPTKERYKQKSRKLELTPATANSNVEDKVTWVSGKAQPRCCSHRFERPRICWNWLPSRNQVNSLFESSRRCGGQTQDARHGNYYWKCRRGYRYRWARCKCLLGEYVAMSSAITGHNTVDLLHDIQLTASWPSGPVADRVAKASRKQARYLALRSAGWNHIEEMPRLE